MSTFIIEQNIDEYIQQLKTKPMPELRKVMTIQSFNDKRWKLQSDFRNKLDSLLQCGTEICFLWKDENTEATSRIIKNIEIISFYIRICISNITRIYHLDSKIKIIQDFYENTEIKQHLLLIQNQCLDLFQSVSHLQDILTSKAEEISKQRKNDKLLTDLNKKFVSEPLNADKIVDISYTLNQLYGDMSEIPQDQIELIDKYLALVNYIITVNLIYKFDFIAENEKIEKDERISIVDKERRRIAALPNPISRLEKENNESKTKIKKIEEENNELKTKIKKLEEELCEKEKIYLSKRQELEEQIQEINMEIIPLMTHKA